MEPGDLLDHGSGDDSVIVVMKGGGQPLNLLLVLVELLEIISVHGINLVFLQTHFVLSPGHVLQPENIKCKMAVIQEYVM